MTRHDKLPILKHPCHIIFVYAKYLSCFYTDGHAQILSLLPPFQGKTVLELGAGIGRFTSELAKEADQLIAVDFIDSVIKKVCIYISLQWLNFLVSIIHDFRHVHGPCRARFDPILSLNGLDLGPGQDLGLIFIPKT